MHNDDDAKILLSPLDNDIPDSTMDVAHLVHRGRRKVNIRRTIAGMAATAVVAAGIPVAMLLIRSPQPVTDPAAITCQMQRLPLPAGITNGAVYDGESSGRYLVGIATSKDQARVVLWDNGQLTVLDPPVTDPHSVVVNSSGMVAGNGENAAGKGVAWVYRGGKYQVLPAPKDGYVSFADINEQGDVVGSVNPLNQAPAVKVWATDPIRVAREMTTPAGLTEAQPFAFHESGAMLVWAKGSDGAVHSLMWTPAGAVKELTSPFSAARPTAWTWRGDWVAGWYTPPGGTSTSVRWNTSTGIADTLPRGTNPNVVNHRGMIAGSVTDADGTQHPVITLDGRKLVRLPIPTESVETLKQPNGHSPTIRFFSDDGTAVAGTVPTADRTNVAVRWTCG